MSLATILLPLLAQVGPGGALPQAPLPDRRAKAPTSQASALPPRPAELSTELQGCLTAAMENPADAIDKADGWLAGAKTAKDKASAQQCKALALSRSEDWAEAAELFWAARDNTPANEIRERARLGALAGNAAIAAGEYADALIPLDKAHADASADGAGAGELDGLIQIDRARALVLLNRGDEAAKALQQARAEVPKNAQAWLLSATLSRRQGKLSDAQQQIERAAELMPIDPEIGLEAGVIAVESGRDEAARKSWQSVIAAAPGSAFAKTAQGYLDQLGPPRASPAK
jgi:tetratricopeptide (TPR) repeat protein